MSRKAGSFMSIICDNPHPSQPREAVLVQCAISHRDEFEVSVFADLAVVKRRHLHSEIEPDEIDKPEYKRGKVTTFSRRSRKRMLEKLAKLRDASSGHFITLTYPGRFDWSPSDVKRHLDNFSKALLRRFPGCGAFWRMEIKPRQSGESEGEPVPHFHILLFGANPPSLAYMRRWIQVTWSRIAAYPDSEPQKLRTQCDEITSRRHAASYASKYAAKEADSTLVLYPQWIELGWGRHWGTFGALNLDETMNVTLDQHELIQFKRLVRNWMKSRGARYAKKLAHFRADFGFSAFGLGDMSPGGGGELFGATITRMLLAVT